MIYFYSQEIEPLGKIFNSWIWILSKSLYMSLKNAYGFVTDLAGQFTEYLLNFYFILARSTTL